jgi:GNAT superfamily N-acetyltransferase
VSEPTETVVIAPVADVAAEPRLPEGVSLGEVTARTDFERIAAMESSVWEDEHCWLPDMLESEREGDPDSRTIEVAETEFAALFGGATLAEWRRRGIYRATVAYRANLAEERGFRYLETDASEDSSPILERLGFVPVTTTTPYIWSPPD